MTVSVLRLFLAVPWIGLRCVIVVFPDHTHLPFLAVRMIYDIKLRENGNFDTIQAYDKLLLCKENDNEILHHLRTL